MTVVVHWHRSRATGNLLGTLFFFVFVAGRLLHGYWNGYWILNNRAEPSKNGKYTLQQ
jgi:hypothetical protein